MKREAPGYSMPWRALMLVSLLPFSGIAAEPVKGMQTPSAIDLSLPIHQKPKLHPELSDPVLGDQAHIVEWAWSPQYAGRFGLKPQHDGLPNGGLWLVGVKIERQQYQQWQRYTCNIIGVMDNKVPILTPPGEYLYDYLKWQGVLPGTGMGLVGGIEYTPGQLAWYRYPKNKAEREKPETGIGTPYVVYLRHYMSDLAYFELAGGCSYFRDPEKFRHEVRFPTQAVGKKDEAVFESSAVKFDLPDNLIRRIRPYTVDADDWTTCLLRRTGLAGMTLALHAIKTKRFGNICEPPSQRKK